MPHIEKTPKPKRSKSTKPTILVDRCPPCDHLAIEPVSCREGRLLQCRNPECEAAFHPQRNADDAQLKSIAWLIHPPQVVDHIDARAFGDHHGLAGKSVGVVFASNDDEARRQATFEAVAAIESGASEVRIVETTRHLLDDPGILYLEWMISSTVAIGGAL